MVAFTRLKRSPFAPVAVAALALLAALVRWQLQGSGNLYTAIDKRFYVPDVELEWRVSPHHPIWIGLELCAVIVLIAAGLAVTGYAIGRWERARGSRATVARAMTWLAASILLAAPVAAFASGWRPARAQDTLPARAAVRIESGIAGAVDAPAGPYAIADQAGSAVTAHLSSGGEAFDAVFAGDLRGSWQGNPRDLRQPMQARISVAAASVDTGIGDRSKHARNGYLRAGEFPRIEFALDRLIAVRSDGPHAVAFRAAGTVHLLGRAHPVEVTGTLRRADAASLQRLGLTGDVLLVQGDLALAIRDTALAKDAGDFDGDRIPIHVSLILRRTTD